jgi:hypothetical protein
MQLINTIYTLLTFALLLLFINYFGKFVEIPSTIVFLVLVLSAVVFIIRMYLRFTQRKK